jgi:hypothetical protein
MSIRQWQAKQFNIFEQLAEEFASLGRPALRDDVQKYRRRLIKAGIIADSARGAEEKNRGGRPKALSAEQVREMQARAVELWPEYGALEGAQGRIIEVIRGEWGRRGIKVYFSTIRRHVMIPLGF